MDFVTKLLTRADPSPRVPLFSWNTAEEIDHRVKQHIAEAYDINISDISDQTHFGYDLHDSLQIVEVIMGCEQDFGIVMPDEDAEKLETVGLFVAHVQKKAGITA